MDTSASPKGTIEKLLGMKNAAEHSIFLQRWAAQAATSLPPGVALSEVTEHMCLNVQSYMVVGDAEGVPRYVLVSAVKTKVLQKRLRAFSTNKVQAAAPSVSEEDEPQVQSATPRNSRAKATPKKSAKLTKPKVSPSKSPAEEVPQRDSSKEAKQFLEMSALLSIMEAKRIRKSKKQGVNDIQTCN